MGAKEKFQEAVELCLGHRIYPGPLAILRILRPGTTRHSLNGRQLKWRAETLLAAGWKRHPKARPAAWRRGKGYPRFAWISWISPKATRNV